LPQAGRPKAGFILESRFTGKSVFAGDPISITLSVKNVTNRTTTVMYERGENDPEIWVRDEKGLPAKLARKGIGRYDWDWFSVAGSATSWDVRPGGAVGSHFPLGEYFVTDEPGTFTVLAAKWVAGDPQTKETERGGFCQLVAKPLTIKVEPRPLQSPGNKEMNVSGARPARSLYPDEPGDKEWKARVRNAGESAEGCVLDAIDSPLAPGKAELVVSLRCEELRDRDWCRAVKETNETDYRVLLRDRVGHPVAPIHVVTTTSRDRSNETGEADPSVDLRRGDATGAIIPLKKYFDLTKPGEYWVLVSLPSWSTGQPGWVAEPIKVRVDAESPAPKK
jgi:hypothetical protein